MISVGYYQGEEYRGQAWEALEAGLKRLGHPFLKKPEFEPGTWRFDAQSYEVTGDGIFPVPSIADSDWRLAISLIQNGKPDSQIVILLPHWPNNEPMIITMGVADREEEWLMKMVSQLLTQYGKWIGKG